MVETSQKILLKDEVQLTALDFVPPCNYAEPSAASRVEITPRFRRSPLTPLPARTGCVSLDNADAVIDGVTAEFATVLRNVRIDTGP